MKKDKVLELFRELAGERAELLNPGTFPTESCNKAVSALFLKKQAGNEAELKRNDEICHNLLDWQRDAAFVVALTLFPERFTKKDIREEIGSLICHMPYHAKELERLYYRYDDDEPAPKTCIKRKKTKSSSKRKRF